MKRHLVFFYWLLLLVSTLAIGGVTFYLLQRETDRLRNIAMDSAVRTGEDICSHLNLLVDDVKTTSMDVLSKLPDGPELVPQLVMWKDTTPAAYTVFYYVPGPGHGLEWPPTTDPSRQVIEPLLRMRNGGLVWNELSQRQWGTISRTRNSPVADNYSQMIASRQQIRQSVQNGTVASPGGNPAPATSTDSLNGVANEPPPMLTTSGNLEISHTTIISFYNGKAFDISNIVPEDFVQNLTGNNPAGKQVNLVQQIQDMLTKMGDASGLAQSLTDQQLVTLVTTSRPSNPEQGWAQVGPEQDPRWLGWMRMRFGAPVFGLLLNWDGVPMRKAFPEHLNQADGFILRNPAGKAVIARFANGALVQGAHGDAPVDDTNAKPAFLWTQKMPVGAEMPGWSLEVYFNPDARFSSNFMALVTVLVAVLVISVLVGGTLLMREARREAYDAARKTSFVSNVSHELKTPLTTIRIYAELLDEGRVRDQAKQHSYLSTIVNESQRLTRLVNNVLDFSRLEQGRKQYHPDNVPLAEVVRSVLDAQHPRLEEAGFQTETDLTAAVDLHVHTDRDALEQVLLNLIDNALKYAADGHWLGVSITHDTKHARLIVSDRGPGVPADEQERIFEMFHRVDDSITARSPGAGLGLSIARRLLRDQEGDLRYEPNSTGGASFVATLPLAEPTEKSPPASV